jgi:hypothetical protein
MFGFFKNHAGGNRSHAAASDLDRTLTILLLKWVQAEPGTKFQTGCHMIESLRWVLPDVDFSRNLYPQFTPVGRNWESRPLKNLATEMLDNSAAAESVNPALHIALGVAGQFLLLWSLSIETRDDQVKHDLGAVYANHIRMANDFIQYALYSMAAGGVAPSAEVAAALAKPLGQHTM